MQQPCLPRSLCVLPENRAPLEVRLCDSDNRASSRERGTKSPEGEPWRPQRPGARGPVPVTDGAGVPVYENVCVSVHALCTSCFSSHKLGSEMEKQREGRASAATKSSLVLALWAVSRDPLQCFSGLLVKMIFNE